MKTNHSDSRLYSIILLLAGSLILLFTGGKFNFWLAAWFPSIFFIRFFRKGRIISRYLFTVLIIWIVSMISWFGIQPLDFVSYAISMLITTILTVLPLLGDRLLYKTVPSFASTLVFPIFSTFLEYVFISGNPMGSFGSLAYSQFDNRFFIQLAGITGIMGLTFFMNWFPAIVNQLWEKKNKRPVYVFIILLIGIYSYGSIIYFSDTGTEKVDVSGIFKAHSEINLHTIMSADENIRYEMADELVESYMDETFLLARSGQSVISWPEGSVITGSENYSGKEKIFSVMADELNIYLIVPYIVIHVNEPFENKLVMYDPNGDTSLNHVKYGGNMFEGSLKGDGTIESVDTEFGRFSSVICWDMDFPSVISQTGRNNVDILFSPSNEWSQIIPVHAQMAVFRGIENGSSTVHTASMGYSLIADYRGKILAEENWFESENRSISASIPVNGKTTIYSRIGDIFPMMITVSAALLIVYSIVSGIKKKIKIQKHFRKINSLQ